MSIIIHRENQEMLWNLTDKIDQIKKHFVHAASDSKPQWFKSILRIFYEKYKDQPIALNELTRINQEIIVHMIQSVQPVPLPSPMTSPLPSPLPSPMTSPLPSPMTSPLPSPMTNPMTNPISGPTMEHTLPHSRDIKQDSYMHRFEEKQKEYQLLHSRPLPSEVNFQDGVTDTAISNMDELVRNHIREREVELKQYAPSPPTTPSALPPPTTHRLQVDKQSANIRLEVDTQYDSDSKKSVSWVDNIYKDEIKTELDSLRQMMTAMLVKMDNLNEEVIGLRKTTTVPDQLPTSANLQVVAEPKFTIDKQFDE